MADTVYPRACGGTVHSIVCVSAGSGLSPRVRGNRLDSFDADRSLRSIPARAGEPVRIIAYEVVLGSIPARAGEPKLLADRPSSSNSGVYPRACGGTITGLSPRVRGNTRYEGLSPRVRGNLDRGSRAVRLPGSIPARAGEPLSMSA